MTDIVKRLRECSSDEAYLSRQAADEITRLRAENERLQEALCPLAGMFLYPDDLGFEASSDIKEDLDWDDDANDMNTENVFVLRRDIRRARAAMQGK